MAKKKKVNDAALVANTKQGGTVPNEGKCCTCKSYKRCKGRAEPCAKTGKYTPRKATCSNYKLR